MTSAPITLDATPKPNETTTMNSTYTFCLDAIAQGRTVLVYAGITAKTAKHVKDAGRLSMVGDELYVDGVSAKGMTVCLKPEKWNG